MTTATNAPATPTNRAEWLRRLLADVQRETANQPTPQAIRRIRQRVLTRIKTPARVAA